MRHVPGILEIWARVKESQAVRREAASAKHVSKALQSCGYESCRKYLEVALCFRSRTVWQRGWAHFIKVNPASPRIQIEQRLQYRAMAKKNSSHTHPRCWWKIGQRFAKVTGASGRITFHLQDTPSAHRLLCNWFTLAPLRGWGPSAPSEVNKIDMSKLSKRECRIHPNTKITTMINLTTRILPEKTSPRR